MQDAEMPSVNTVFGDFLWMASKSDGPMPQWMPTRFLVRRFNLPRHLPRGAMPHEDDTADLPQLEQSQPCRGGRSAVRRMNARTAHRETEAMKWAAQFLA